MSVAANPDWTNAAHLRSIHTLYELLVALSGAKALQDVYDTAVKTLLAATAADRSAILVFDDDGVMRFKAWLGLSAAYREAVSGHTPWTKGSLDAQVIVIPDVRCDPSLAQFGDLFAREGIRALAFVPLSLEAGVFGKFMLYYREPHECSSEELAIAQAIAAHVALATEHKRIQLACSRSEERLQAIIDHSPAVVFVKDADGRYLLVNRRYQELFHRGTDILGRTDHDIFPSDVAERFRENDRRVFATGLPVTVEETAPQDDGIHTYVSVKFPLEKSHGRTTAICGIATDVTEQKLLDSAPMRLAAIVENSDDAIVSKNLNGIITSWNRGAERLFGYTAAEAVGRPVSILAPSALVNEMPDILGKIRRGERVDHYETCRRAKNGDIIDVSLTISPIRDVSGHIIGASKIARDITERKRADAERALLSAREHEARQTAELLNQIGPRLASQLNADKLVQEIADISTALVGAELGSFVHHVVDQKGEWQILSAHSGVSRDALQGSPHTTSTDVTGPVFRGAGIIRRDDVAADPRYQNHLPGLGKPQGGVTVRSYLAAPVVSRTGEVLGGLFFGHSLPAKFTSNHEAALKGFAFHAAIAMENARLFQQAEFSQAELKRFNQDLRRANEDLETFAYSASHDLQEPLRTVGLCAQLLERNVAGRLDGENSDLLATILNASGRMTTLIEDLLAYTKAARQPEGPPPMADSAAILASTLDSLRSQMEQSGAVVTSENLPLISIHESRLGLLFQNLISNALKYRRETPRIHVSAVERDGSWVVSVSDNGIGIDQEYSGQIFGIFKRLHGRNDYEGSGVGLAICQRVVEHYGGLIWLEKSASGVGSTFCFSIPVSARQS